MNPKFMEKALAEARQGINNNEGGPFGAVVFKGNKVISRAHNQVVLTHDPTAHAEILAIRKAAKKLGRFNLSDCEIYSTCEPCPMCLAAIHWAKMRKVYYGCSRRDAAAIGFDDGYLYRVFRGTAAKKQVVLKQRGRPNCLPVLKSWTSKPNKVIY